MLSFRSGARTVMRWSFKLEHNFRQPIIMLSAIQFSSQILLLCSNHINKFQQNFAVTHEMCHRFLLRYSTLPLCTSTDTHTHTNELWTELLFWTLLPLAHTIVTLNLLRHCSIIKLYLLLVMTLPSLFLFRRPLVRLFTSTSLVWISRALNTPPRDPLVDLRTLQLLHSTTSFERTN